MGTILLDFDGVVFDNPRVHALITERSVAFTQRRLKLRTLKEARYINSSLYPIKGHTARILDDPNDIHEYNREVFDESFLYQVHTLVDSNDIHHAQRLVSLRKRVPKKYTFHLCTNATRSYCETIFHAMGLSMSDLFDMSYVFTSENGLVKPQPEFWKHIEHTCPEQRLTLVDDSPLNILGINALPRWDAVLINESNDVYTYLSHLISENF